MAQPGCLNRQRQAPQPLTAPPWPSADTAQPQGGGHRRHAGAGEESDADGVSATSGVLSATSGVSSSEGASMSLGVTKPVLLVDCDNSYWGVSGPCCKCEEALRFLLDSDTGARLMRGHKVDYKNGLQLMR